MEKAMSRRRFETPLQTSQTTENIGNITEHNLVPIFR